MARSPVDILKAISLFGQDDFKDREARDKLSMLFRELIMNGDPKSDEFLQRFLKGVGGLIYDMGLIDKPEDDLSGDDVEMPDEEPEQEMPVDDVPAEEEIPAEDDEEEGIPDDMISASYRPTPHDNLCNEANSFLV